MQVDTVVDMADRTRTDNWLFTVSWDQAKHTWICYPSAGIELSGWGNIMRHLDEEGWELVSACVAGTAISGDMRGDTGTTTTGYKLFVRRPR